MTISTIIKHRVKNLNQTFSITNPILKRNLLPKKNKKIILSDMQSVFLIRTLYFYLMSHHAISLSHSDNLFFYPMSHHAISLSHSDNLFFYPMSHHAISLSHSDNLFFYPMSHQTFFSLKWNRCVQKLVADWSFEMWHHRQCFRC
jgi:hypothetical protein